MAAILWVCVLTPLFGFVFLILLGARLPKRAAAAVGVATVGVSALLAVIAAVLFLGSPTSGKAFSDTLFTWIATSDAVVGSSDGTAAGNEAGGAAGFSGGTAGVFRAAIALRLDSLSLLMVLVVTVVGFLIHLYSAEYMAPEEGIHRFFAFMNLFISAMLVLVLADNFLFLYLGWELVGLCSYLLIGFWYMDPENGRAARKAFIVTRIGDTALMVGILLLFSRLGTLNIQETMGLASSRWVPGSALAVAAAALLLGGAVGKSAQFPLQVWLPDAMAGPTPVSALIHAATMVTAGVYLIARTHVLFSLAPAVQAAVAVVGAATLLLAGSSALVQTDIKRVLAYSTISQIGYMFAALGAGAWSAAVFHFMIHAFFKALLFLGAGVVIMSLGHEQDMFRMGGLRKAMPLTFWCFLAGAASLSAVPFVTAGFYSKEWILWGEWMVRGSWEAQKGPALWNHWLWVAGATGSLITALYSFRMVFLVFFGENKGRISHRPGAKMIVPLVPLAVFSVLAGFLETPGSLGNIRIFSGFMGEVFAQPTSETVSRGLEVMIQIVVSGLTALGIVIAYLRFGRRFDRRNGPVTRFLRGGLGFDFLYDRIFVRPFVFVTRVNRDDVVDLFYKGVERVNLGAHRLLSRTQSGKLRWYVAGILAGALILIAIVVAL
jgi:NADH-quinone oxidoreductase subunit L